MSAARQVGLVAAVIAVAAAVGVGSTLATTDARTLAPAVVATAPVIETTVACPGLRSREGYTESTVAAATPPLGKSTPTASSPTENANAAVRTLTKNPADSLVLIRLTQPGERGRYVGRSGERDSVVGRGAGALAPGFSVTQTERTVDGAGRGIASTSCLPTGADFWFVGAASGVGQRATLVLTNPEDATASVDVDLYGTRGPVDAPAARGIQVKPRSRTELRLDQVAPGEAVLAVHVKVTSGRLSAALTETDVDGLQPRGTDWIPSAVPPDTHQIVPGVPPVAQGRESKVVLDVANPGEADAVVKLALTTSDGEFSPSGHDVLEVPAGTVKSFDLTGSLRGQAASLSLQSDVPVTAGARVLLKRPSYYGDVLFLSAAAPLSDAAVVPDNETTTDLQTRLVLTAPEESATVAVSAFNATTSRRTVVTIDAGTTKVVTIKPPQGMRRYGLVVTPAPGSGPVVGVRFLDEEGSRGPLVSALPLRAARLTALVRPAIPELTSGMPGYGS
ncbi:MAG: DUF5719 family protein [Actinomycetes bacterium]